MCVLLIAQSLLLFKAFTFSLMQLSSMEVAKGACSKHFCDAGQLLSALVRADVFRRRQNISGKGTLFIASPSGKK